MTRQDGTFSDSDIEIRKRREVDAVRDGDRPDTGPVQGKALDGRCHQDPAVRSVHMRVQTGQDQSRRDREQDRHGGPRRRDDEPSVHAQGQPSPRHAMSHRARLMNP